MGDLDIKLADQLIQIGRVLAPDGDGVAAQLRLGAHREPELLCLVGSRGGQVRLMLEMPALPALRGAQHLGAFGARRADADQSRPARHHH